MPTWPQIRKTNNIRSLHDFRKKKSYAIQSQYSASERILLLADIYQQHLDISGDEDLFYKKIFNILSAEAWGLDNWGRILGIGRVIEDPQTGVNINLPDDYYRLLLLYKALANISRANAASLNKLLKTLLQTNAAGFGDMAAYVLEIGPMVIRWVFEDFLDDTQAAVFNTAGTLARGAGVGWELYAVNPSEVFGFAGSVFLPFNQASFAPDNALIKPQRSLNANTQSA